MSLRTSLSGWYIRKRHVHRKKTVWRLTMYRWCTASRPGLLHVDAEVQVEVADVFRYICTLLGVQFHCSRNIATVTVILHHAVLKRGTSFRFGISPNPLRNL